MRVAIAVSVIALAVVVVLGLGEERTPVSAPQQAGEAREPPSISIGGPSRGTLAATPLALLETGVMHVFDTEGVPAPLVRVLPLRGDAQAPGWLSRGTPHMTVDGVLDLAGLPAPPFVLLAGEQCALVRGLPLPNSIRLRLPARLLLTVRPRLGWVAARSGPFHLRALARQVEASTPWFVPLGLGEGPLAVALERRGDVVARRDLRAEAGETLRVGLAAEPSCTVHITLLGPSGEPTAVDHLEVRPRDEGHPVLVERSVASARFRAPLGSHWVLSARSAAFAGAREIRVGVETIQRETLALQSMVPVTFRLQGAPPGAAVSVHVETGMISQKIDLCGDLVIPLVPGLFSYWRWVDRAGHLRPIQWIHSAYRGTAFSVAARCVVSIPWPGDTAPLTVVMGPAFAGRRCAAHLSHDEVSWSGSVQADPQGVAHFHAPDAKFVRTGPVGNLLDARISDSRIVDLRPAVWRVILEDGPPEALRVEIGSQEGGRTAVRWGARRQTLSILTKGAPSIQLGDGSRLHGTDDRKARRTHFRYPYDDGGRAFRVRIVPDDMSEVVVGSAQVHRWDRSVATARFGADGWLDRSFPRCPKSVRVLTLNGAPVAGGSIPLTGPPTAAATWILHIARLVRPVGKQWPGSLGGRPLRDVRLPGGQSVVLDACREWAQSRTWPEGPLEAVPVMGSPVVRKAAELGRFRVVLHAGRIETIDD